MDYINSLEGHVPAGEDPENNENNQGSRRVGSQGKAGPAEIIPSKREHYRKEKEAVDRRLLFT